MLRLQAVSKHYMHRGRPIQALRDVDMELPRGDYASVVGPSGSGKSTLLLVAGGMLSPTAGEVVLGGVPLYGLPPDERAKIRRSTVGFVFQTFNLVPYLTALENVQVPIFLAGEEVSRQRERALALLERLGLADRIDHKPAELSVGQQQRVALARMLANDPPLIVADEPTGSLDPATSADVLRFLDELHAEGKAILMVTHDLEAARRAERVVFLENGALVPREEARSLAAG